MVHTYSVLIPKVHSVLTGCGPLIKVIRLIEMVYLLIHVHACSWVNSKTAYITEAQACVIHVYCKYTDH